MANNGSSVRMKQLCHLCLCQPHGFILHTDIYLGLSVLGLINDNLIVDKITYRFSDPQRFDIIVFPYEPDFAYYVDTEPVYYIKRIIGMPGERIRIDEQGNIYINDKILEESYGKEVIMYAGRASETIELGENEYFVMGDNRNNSSDSREPSVGNIQREDIIGRAWLRIWPFEKFGILKHQ